MTEVVEMTEEISVGTDALISPNIIARSQVRFG